MDRYLWYAARGISREVFALSEQAIKLAEEPFSRVDLIREKRQLDVLAAFEKARVSESAFIAKTGYGYDDAGRVQTEAVFAHAFGAEDALVRLQFSSGTHVIATCLRSLLAPGDEMLIVTGKPYDSFLPTLGRIENAKDGSLVNGAQQSRQSLSARGVKIRQIDLLGRGYPDLDAIGACIDPATRIVYIQKSRGYSDRRALLVEDIQSIVDTVRSVSGDVIVFVDHCYSEFVEMTEPPQVGADLIAGSLIKNPGSGIAPSGGYIAGRAHLIEEISEGMTAIGVGRHIGPSLGQSRLLLQGLYFAPTVTASSMKGAIHLALLFSLAGYSVTPEPDEERGDIVQIVHLGTPEKLETFCQAIQSAAPVDGFVTPIPAPMPGYDCDIIMASGSFIQGSTIELSADGPIRPPYDVYVQGGLTFENARLGAMMALERIRQPAPKY